MPSSLWYGVLLLRKSGVPTMMYAAHPATGNAANAKIQTRSLRNGLTLLPAIRSTTIMASMMRKVSSNGCHSLPRRVVPAKFNALYTGRAV